METASLFESILSTHQVRAFKPDPRAYEMGVKSFNVRFEKKSKNHGDSGQRTPLGRVLATLSIPVRQSKVNQGAFKPVGDSLASKLELHR